MAKKVQAETGLQGPMAPGTITVNGSAFTLHKQFLVGPGRPKSDAMDAARNSVAGRRDWTVREVVRGGEVVAVGAYKRGGGLPPGGVEEI